jgi:type I restriction enzyme R subunit
MTNFQFLHLEFKPLLEPAKGAEQLVYSDPRACCMRTRHAPASGNRAIQR